MELGVVARNPPLEAVTLCGACGRAKLCRMAGPWPPAATAASAGLVARGKTRTVDRAVVRNKPHSRVVFYGASVQDYG